jgi:endothelin-converting enzyme/putative endopeptidase
MKMSLLTVALLMAAQAGVAAIAQTPASAAKDAPEQLPGLNTAFMDKTADPCTDFYKYACGNFAAVHPIPADRSRLGNFDLVYENNLFILHAILDKSAAGGASRTANEQKIGDFYSSCMDTAAIDREGLKLFQPELDRIAALKSKEELTGLLAHDQMINVNALFGYGEQQDFKDATKQIAALDQGGLGLPERDYYLRTGVEDEKIRQQYVAHIANTFKLLGEPDAKAAEDARQVMDLETALAKASMDVTSRRDPNNVYHMVLLTDLEKTAPAIDWSRLLQITKTPPVTDLNVTNPDFFKTLNALIESTPLDTLKTYLTWQLINSIPPTALPNAFDAEQFAFNGKILRGQLEQRPRWKRCVAATDTALGEALGQVYAAQAFSAASKEATLAMVRDIEAAMDADIDQLNWMSPETKAKAKEKLRAVANKIGYPNKWRDYSSLAIVRGQELGNEFRAAEFENHRELNKIGKPVDRGEFFMSPPTVNAYYNPLMNDINFPAGILQPPFYDPSEPDAVNYGHIGAVVGHELTHGFDDQGRQFDANGNLADWWTASDEKQFVDKTDCEVKEYGEFTVPGDVHVNGKLTLGENTADNGGIRLAYAAFLEDAKRKTIDLNSKQNGLTPLQEFFVAFAQNWCAEMRPEREREQVQTDGHSPDEFRANGVVRNMPEFGNAFNCKPGQAMVPATMCRVW